MKKNKMYLIVTLALSVIVITLSIVYLVTGKMIPGVNCFCTATLVLIMAFSKKYGKFSQVLFGIAAVLNIIVGILQIMGK